MHVNLLFEYVVVLLGQFYVYWGTIVLACVKLCLVLDPSKCQQEIINLLYKGNAMVHKAIKMGLYQ